MTATLLDRSSGEHEFPLWDTEPAAELARLEGDVEAHYCVVGLGGSGLACVRELRRLGAEVVGLDAATVGSGAAGRNGGFLLAGLAPFHHDAVERFGRERATMLYHRTLEELDRIEAETPAVVTRRGSLRIADSGSERADCARQLERMRGDGLAAERYDGPEGEGLLFPSDGVFQPLLRCRALAEEAVRHGARLYERSRVTAVEDGIVRTVDGAVRARCIIVAVDGGLERLLPELESRVRSTRLQMLGTAPESGVHFPRPVYTRWGYDYWQQWTNGTVALGGARDVGGDEEFTTEARPTPVVQDALERRLRSLGVTARVTHRWAAIVGYTPDALPIVQEVRPRVWAIGGYSGTGNVIGSLLGRGLARHLAADDGGLLRGFTS